MTAKVSTLVCLLLNAVAAVALILWGGHEASESSGIVFLFVALPWCLLSMFWSLYNLTAAGETIIIRLLGYLGSILCLSYIAAAFFPSNSLSDGTKYFATLAFLSTLGLIVLRLSRKRRSSFGLAAAGVSMTVVIVLACELMLARQ